ncbi:DM13 domain-containing protein [Streptomyces sp. NRRL F-2580]|uniref:DM13 domain-containing protein n=1 Tax=Streptomyces sp. NRRL F-2580 TaxID=1463841 RepID=UPI0004C809E0|nr:DM13 domain-containing protein [Streptomyces sp. NRRL F-2580]
MVREQGRRRRPLLIGGAAVAAAGLAFGLYWFEPWKLWVEESVHEAAPSVSAAPNPAASANPPAAPRTVAEGSLISHEHATTGTVKLLRLADGSHVLRVENLDTSNGPALKVWLTDAPVIEGVDGWHVFDDGKHVSLGALKGNKGDQNYPVPTGVNLADYTSLAIWCDRFDVSFGAATLKPV